jgi:hypothetical protein
MFPEYSWYFNISWVSLPSINYCDNSIVTSRLDFTDNALRLPIAFQDGNMRQDQMSHVLPAVYDTLVPLDC